MPYEINVSYKVHHLFTTHPRSAVCEADAFKIYREITSRFKESEGYEISVTEWETEGHNVTKEMYIKELQLRRGNGYEKKKLL